MKNTIQSLFLALAFVSSSMVAHAAVDVSQVPVDITQDLIDYSSSDFGRTLSGLYSGMGNNFFSDKYTFTTGNFNDVAALMTSLKATPGSGLTITGFDLRNASSIVFQGTQDIVNFLPSEQAWSFASGMNPLPSGSYTLEVNGYVASPNGGSYSGNIGISAAVPEPETYGMLLAGMSMLAFLAYRRKDAA